MYSTSNREDRSCISPSDQVYLLEKTNTNLLEVNKFLEFCKSRENSSNKNDKTSSNFFKIVKQPINLLNFSDPLFVPVQPTSTSKNFPTKTLGIKQFFEPSGSILLNAYLSPPSKKMTLLTSPTILPKKTQKPLCVKQFSNPSGSILLNSSLSSTSSFYSSSPFSSSRFSYSLFSSSPSYSSPSSNPLTLLTLGDQVFTNSI